MAAPQTNPTKAALEEAVLDLTDDEIIEALLRRPLVDEIITRRNDIKQAFEARRAYAWPAEARRNLLGALAKRLESGRVAASG
ncbi:MAG TPA: hypothetical protein VFA46_01910 [Actinomycetes bacterium]|jgi:hypothetical protein|nr:hypothetical protein [Actinomycetes bacterium]